MTFDWPQFLEVARETAGSREPAELADARGRAAVSRAYYAAFGAALRYFAERGDYAPSQRGDDHERLAASLRGHRDSRFRQIGECLDRLRPARRWADYDRGAPRRELSCAGTVTALAQAARALELLAVADRR